MTTTTRVPASDSTTWKLQREVVLLAGWGRAILLQIAHPLVAQGVADHSGFAAERWARVGRLKRTVEAMLALTFGTPAESAAAAAGINRIHDRVHGRLPQPAGAFASGSGYSAHDPKLLTWVHVTLVDTFLVTYERFVAPLTPAERDRYCVEATVSAPLLGSRRRRCHAPRPSCLPAWSGCSRVIRSRSQTPRGASPTKSSREHCPGRRGHCSRWRGYRQWACSPRRSVRPTASSGRRARSGRSAC